MYWSSYSQFDTESEVSFMCAGFMRKLKPNGKTMIIYKECCNMIFQLFLLVFELDKKLCLSLEQLVTMRSKKKSHYSITCLLDDLFFRSIKYISLHDEKKAAANAAMRGDNSLNKSGKNFSKSNSKNKLIIIM